MPSVTYDLAAASCPAPAGPGTTTYAADSASTEGGNLVGARPITSGDAANFVAYSDWNAKMLDVSAQAGAPGYAVLKGLTFSASGLTLTVAKGQAVVNGPIELSADTTAVLTDSATNYVWLKAPTTPGGSASIVVKTTTANEANAVFLGSVPVAAGAATAYDYSGVFCWRGVMVRKTADSYKPADTPGVTWCFINQCSGASYLWDGAKYRFLGAADEQIPDQYSYQAISGTVTLLITDPKRQIFKNTSGSSQKVLAPSDTGTSWGMGFHIRSHKDSTSSILVRNHGDTATLATLTAGQTYDLEPDDDDGSGNPIWPIA